jgi:hypothetical protein
MSILGTYGRELNAYKWEDRPIDAHFNPYDVSVEDSLARCALVTDKRPIWFFFQAGTVSVERRRTAFAANKTSTFGTNDAPIYIIMIRQNRLFLLLGFLNNFAIFHVLKTLHLQSGQLNTASRQTFFTSK